MDVSPAARPPRYPAPYDLLDLEERIGEQLGPLNEELVRGFASALKQVGYYGRRLYRDADGRVGSEASKEARLGLDYDNPAWPVVYDAQQQLYLPRDEARALQRELRGIHARYLPRREVGTGDRYLLYVALVPQPDG